MPPYDILRVATPEDEGEDDQHRELGREIRDEAQKLARDHRVKDVQFFGCDVSLDRSYVEVKYGSENGWPDLDPIQDGLRRRYDARVVLRRFSFIDRASDSGGCDTCGVPLCCATWSGARSMGPVNVRLAKQQGVTPNDKIMGCCGEVKCCMRYEHDTYKEFKERAPFRNSTVKYKAKSASSDYRCPGLAWSISARGGATAAGSRVPRPREPRYKPRIPKIGTGEPPVDGSDSSAPPIIRLNLLC